MGLLLVFAAGYVMGARAGGESLDEVIDAVHAIRESDEFHDLVRPCEPTLLDSLRGLGHNARRDAEPIGRRRSSNDLLDRVSSSSDCAERDVLTHAAQADDVARRADGRLGAHREPTRLADSSATRYSSSNGCPVATAASINVREPFAVVGVHDAEVGLEGAFEVERIDAVHPMQFVAPLHRVGADIPQPSTDVGERLPFAEPLLDLGKRGLRQASLGELLGHADGADEHAGCLDDGRHRQRDRHGHAVLALDLGDDAIDTLTCGDTLRYARDRRAGAAARAM